MAQGVYVGQRKVVLLPVQAVLDAFKKKEASLDEIRSFIRSAKGELDDVSITAVQNVGDVMYLPPGLQGALQDIASMLPRHPRFSEIYPRQMPQTH